jgi:hypothetical protein
MNAVVQFPIQIPAQPESLVDQLGKLQAQIATLQDAEQALKEALKTEACATLAVGQSVEVEGALFRATIYETAASRSLDPAKLQAKLAEVIGADAPFFSDAANFKTRKGSITLKVAARKTC